MTAGLYLTVLIDQVDRETDRDRVVYCMCHYNTDISHIEMSDLNPCANRDYLIKC